MDDNNGDVDDVDNGDAVDNDDDDDDDDDDNNNTNDGRDDDRKKLETNRSLKSFLNGTKN